MPGEAAGSGFIDLDVGSVTCAGSGRRSDVASDIGDPEVADILSGKALGRSIYGVCALAAQKRRVPGR